MCKMSTLEIESILDREDSISFHCLKTSDKTDDGGLSSKDSEYFMVGRAQLGLVVSPYSYTETSNRLSEIENLINENHYEFYSEPDECGYIPADDAEMATEISNRWLDELFDMARYQGIEIKLDTRDISQSEYDKLDKRARYAVCMY